MKTISFEKYSGAGNDFIVASGGEVKKAEITKKEISSFCKRRTGIGADGFIIISKSEDHDFTMDYFNADGSTGVLCGNGARCAIKYAKSHNLIKNDSTKFICNNETFIGKVKKNGTIGFRFNDPSNLSLNQVVESIYGEINYSSVNTGAPHIVVDVIDNTQMLGVFSHWDDLPVYNLGKELRHNKEISNEGTNVNFVKFSDGEILIRTFEKGVEDETLACATGSVAAVLILAQKGEVKPPVSLKTRGGELLVVEFEKIGDTISDIWLTGSAIKVYDGKLNL